MKKILTLLVITAVVIGIAGCTRVLTDMELLEQTFANMQEMESYKAQGSITVKFMGMTTEPFLYEMLYEKPDKSYLKMDADIFGIGERITVNTLSKAETSNCAPPSWMKQSRDIGKWWKSPWSRI